jgi:ABC-type transporter Mla subunit MlaD
MDETMEQAGPQLSSILTHLDSVARSADQGLGGLPELDSKLQALLGDLQIVIGPQGERLVGLLDTAEGTLRTAADALAILGQNRQDLDATLRDLRDTMANLKAFSQTIKEQPYSLVRIKSPPQRVPGEGVK